MGGGRGGLPDMKRGGGLPDMKRGGGQSTSGPIYEKWGGGGGGGQFASGPLQKVGGGGGGGPNRVRSRSFASRDPHHISEP